MKEKIQKKREENLILQLEERNPSYCSQSPRFWPSNAVFI